MTFFQGIINDKIEIILKEFQGLLSFGYLILLIMGMFFEAIHYYEFGINIFQYSGILDFLLVPFRRPIVLAILFATLLILFIGYFLDYLIKIQWPKFHTATNFGLPQKSYYLQFRFWTFIIAYLFLCGFYGHIASKKYKEDLLNEKTNIRIDYTIDAKKQISGKLIGKNESYIFLLNDKNDVQILQLNSTIIRIVPL